MSKKIAFVLALGFVFVMEAGNTVAQQADQGAGTLMSSPGKLEIVRHPSVADYTKMSDRGKISTFPSFNTASQKGWQVDVRSCDLSALDLRDRLNDLLQADFDSKTIWPSQLPSGFDYKRIIELGKNPGLGVRSLHAKGINGKNVGIAIIDQPLLVDHAEYKDRLKLYEEINIDSSWEAAMHGPAVASIAVGKTVGVAPGGRPLLHCRLAGKTCRKLSIPL